MSLPGSAAPPATDRRRDIYARQSGEAVQQQRVEARRVFAGRILRRRQRQPEREDAVRRIAGIDLAQREVMAFWTRKLDRTWKAQLYGLVGLSDGSPDWGFGASAAYAF